MDCSGDFGPHGLSVQYTQDVRGCPPAHTRRLWLSLSISTHISTLVLGLSTLALLVDCSAHTGHPWLSISTHISRLVLALSTLILPVDCSGDFGPRGLSVQYTLDVCGCPSAHIGRPWLSVCVRVCPRDFGPRGLSVKYTHDIRGCPSLHISARWPFPWTVRVILAHVGCLFSTHRTSVGVRQHTQDVRSCASVQISARWSLDSARWPFPWTVHDVRVCPSAHTGRSWLSVCVRVCPSAHTGRLWLSISTHISTLVLALSTLTLPVDCWGDFGPRGLSVQYTQDVCGCPPSHTGSPWLSVCVCLCPSAHPGRPWLSISTHISTLVLRLSMLALPVDCFGDFCPRGMSVQYTQDVCGCPPAHKTFVAVTPPIIFQDRTSNAACTYTASRVRPHHRVFLILFRIAGTIHGLLSCPRSWIGSSGRTAVRGNAPVRGVPYLALTAPQETSTLTAPQETSTRQSHRGINLSDRFLLQFLSINLQTDLKEFSQPKFYLHVRVITVAIRVCPSAHTSACWSLDSARWPFPWTVWVILAHVGCLFSTHRSSLGVRQHTQDIRGCPCVSVCTHWTSVAVHQYTYQHAGPWTQHAGPSRGLFGTHKCPSAHIGRPYVSASTHRTFVAVYVCPYVSVSTHDVCGGPSVHISAHCSGDFGPRGLSVQYTQDVCGCPPAHTGRPWLSVCVRLCPSAHPGRLWLSISTHISTLVLGLSTLVLGLSTLALPWTVSVIFNHVGCLFSIHRTSVGVRQHTQDVRGCLWLSVSTHRTSMAVHVCPCVSVSTHMTFVGVRQHTQDVRVCPSEHTGRPVAVRVCPSAHTGRLLLSISTHISTLVLGLSTLALPVECLGDFGPCGLSVQYTQDVRGCPPVHTGRPWVSASTHRTSVAVRGCPSAHT
ncbi:hypothetical protein IGI04_035931 [Brassica rapa subsp. trilocularis]|uniref:CUB domain-containing protein n=1 Tax=Brassica rapa subsp. trilocularis TaxID=1813537 RepID=A0ABQ7LFC7_BRACM|nr:hypothetical protein IGI04_035931 [Brassica rapa subsp. trilocularis]